MTSPNFSSPVHETGPPFSLSKLLVLPAAVMMQMCLGAAYSWSVFVLPLRDAVGVSQGAAQIPFTLFYMIFPLSMLISGMLLERLGTRKMAFFGGLIFSAGWALASFGASNFRWTILGVGLVAGAGCGMGYLVPIAVCVRWFPKRKGLVTGVAVAGFGGGAAVISLFSGGLMHSMGLTPFQAFRVLALVFAVVTPLAGLCLRRPPWARDMNPEIRRIPFHALREPIFWMLFTFMLLGLIAGFTVNANLKELTVGGSVRAGIHAVAFFAVANALGRVLWGLLFDRMQSHNIIRCNLLFQAATLLGSFWLLEAPGGLRLFAFLAGLNYGGVLVIYASTVARIWGPHRTASIYGWLASSNIPAALAPLLAGFAFDYSGHFRVPLFTIAALLIVGSFYTGRILRHANVRD